MVRNQVEAAYARSDLFERRRVLMEEWGRYLAGGPKACAATGVMLEAVAASNRNKSLDKIGSAFSLLEARGGFEPPPP